MRADEYEYALDFPRFAYSKKHAGGAWRRPSTRLDAQSVVWWSPQGLQDPPRPTPPPRPGGSAGACPEHDPLRPARHREDVAHRHARCGESSRTGACTKWSKRRRRTAPPSKRRFDEHWGAGRIETVTFHQNTTYEDFVEGIRPVLAGGESAGADAPAEPGSGGEVRYELSRGVFRRIAERAAQDPDSRYVLVIDEINRGNVARIFGELITLIEDSKRIGQEDEARVTLPGSKTPFGVPANLHVVGTMNTADRSIALLDTALRRRFVFEEMMPDPFHSDVSKDVEGIDCRKLLTAMNRRIAVLLDREHQIGHTYLLRVDTVAALASTFQTRIMPLLQEYFYDDWEKIRAVLNDNAFVRKADPPEELIGSDLMDSSRAVYELLPAQDSRWTAPEGVPGDLPDSEAGGLRNRDAGGRRRATERLTMPAIGEHDRPAGLRGPGERRPPEWRTRPASQPGLPRRCAGGASSPRRTAHPGRARARCADRTR